MVISVLRKHGPIFASALLASALTASAPAIAHGVHAAFAHKAQNADKVDGVHAVKSKASVAKRKGKLVATSPTTGQLPNDIIAKAPDSELLDGFDSTDFLGVNAQATDSNQLDGKDSTDFLGANSQAVDANQLDGKDSTEFLGVNAKAADANLLDGLNSTDFLGAAAKAADANLLDGKDSTVFGNSGSLSFTFAFLDECDAVGTWNECGTLQVTVPAGKSYRVLMTSNGSYTETSATENRVLFCVSARLTTAPAVANCGGTERGLIVKQGHMVPASATRVATLGPGTWVISTGVNPSDPFESIPSFDSGKVTASVLVLDAAANL